MPGNAIMHAQTLFCTDSDWLARRAGRTIAETPALQSMAPAQWGTLRALVHRHRTLNQLTAALKPFFDKQDEKCGNGTLCCCLSIPPTGRFHPLAAR